MNATSWNIVLASAFHKDCSSNKEITALRKTLWRIFLTFECDIQSRHFCVKVCFIHLSSVHTDAWLAMAGSQPCWKDSSQLVMTGQRKPPTSFTTWWAPVQLGRLPVTDGCLGRRLTSVSSFGSTRHTFSRWILWEPDARAADRVPPVFLRCRRNWLHMLHSKDVSFWSGAFAARRCQSISDVLSFKCYFSFLPF